MDRKNCRRLFAHLLLSFALQRADILDGPLARILKTSQLTGQFVLLQQPFVWVDEDLMNAICTADRDSW